MEYEISDQPQENYRPERVALHPEPMDQDPDLHQETRELSCSTVVASQENNASMHRAAVDS